MRISLPKVSIAVLNYNRWQDTIECLESLQRLDYPSFDIIVIDNNSTNNSRQEIENWAFKLKTVTPGAKPVIFLQSSSNKGYAGGNNIGIRHGLDRGADYIWVLNNDTVVDPGALDALVKKAESNPEIGAVGATVYYYDQPQKTQCLGGGYINLLLAVSRHITKRNQSGKLAYINGACLLAKNQTFKETGLFDERFFLYWEDADWSLRARKNGWKISWAPESKIWHKEGRTIGYRSPQAEYHHARSGILFLAKHYNLLAYWAVPVFCISKLANRLCRLEFRNVGRILQGMFHQPGPS